MVVNGDESTPNIISELERDFGLCKNCLLCLSGTESFDKLMKIVGVTGGRVGSIGLAVVAVVLTTGLVCSSVINVLNKVDLVVGKVDVVDFSG